jgi:hypothetical protein
MFQVGMTWPGPALFFAGLVDSVRLMSRALTPDEFLHYPMAAWEYGTGNWKLEDDD